MLKNINIAISFNVEIMLKRIKFSPCWNDTFPDSSEIFYQPSLHANMRKLPEGFPSAPSSIRPQWE